MVKSEGIAIIQEALFHCWSKQSSTKYTLANRASGQCGVTALVVQDLFGGHIVKTKVDGMWHYYNQLHGEYYDFTSSQFQSPIIYEHVPSNRKEAFTDTNASQYNALKTAVFSCFQESKTL
ncbi:hypothetical protein [Bacillus manliponensis]|uniref:YunG family protein n=1 Tax=Bacillus manliponensis TaxID=574376 RepID=UPI0035121266